MIDVNQASVRDAIKRAQDGIFVRQDLDGAWRTGDEAGPPSTGWGLVAIHYLGAHGTYQIAGAVEYLLSTQFPTGAFPEYPADTKGSLAATAACYAGLYAAGTSPSSPAMERAWQYISAQGGFDEVDPITQTFLAAAGLISATQLMRLPMGWMLIPGVRQLMGKHISPAFQLIGNALPGLNHGLRTHREAPTPTGD